MTSVKKTAKKARKNAEKAAKEARARTKLASTLMRGATKSTQTEIGALLDLRTAEGIAANAALYAAELEEKITRTGMTPTTLEEHLEKRREEDEQAREGRMMRLAEKKKR